MASENNYDELFTFESGDVEILATYDNKPVVGKVSSQALALASPVWRKFVFPPWRSLQPEDSAIDLNSPNENSSGSHKANQIDFKEDDGQALLLILRIAHLRFNQIPNKLVYEELLEIAVLVDQYDCYELVQPWLKNWLVDEEKESLIPGHENWLFIAWVFHRKKVFENLATRMVKTIRVNDKGQALSLKKPIESPMPSDILERILAARLQTIERLLDMAYSRIANYEDIKVTQCKERQDQEACDTLVYGSLVRGLQYFHLWPRKTPDQVTMSVDQISTVLITLKIHIFYSDRDHFSHKNCSNVEPFRTQVHSTVATIPSPVQKSHLQHMKTKPK
ncbi:hypothetical protein F5884DRAFT_489470 [Xylogone sp. PMI_703]|nr:hypothetical protein F5884DRAFT_489470 [Xylogone sp. PMI_703]